MGLPVVGEAVLGEAVGETVVGEPVVGEVVGELVVGEDDRDLHTPNSAPAFAGGTHTSLVGWQQSIKGGAPQLV